MARGDDITTRFKLDITDFKKGITEANNQIKLANSEFRAASNGTKEWENSVTGLQSKISQLKSVLDAQNQKLKAYKDELSTAKKYEQESKDKVNELKDALEKAKKVYGENSDEVKKLEEELSDAEAEEEKMKNQVNALNVTVNNQQGVVNRTTAQIDRYSNELENAKNAESDVARGSEEVSQLLEKVGNVALDIAGKALQKFIDKAKEIAVSSVDVGKNFDTAMSEVKAISGATGKEYDKLRDKAKEMGAKTKFSATESANAFKYMAMAGWDTNKMLKGIEGVMKLASASGEDLASTSDIVTDSLTAFGLGAKDANHFVDILARTATSSNTNVSMMGETFKYVAPVAGSFKYKVEDVALAIGLMANAGIKSSQAGTTLRNIFTRLATDAGASSKQLGALGILTKKLGVEFYNADGSMRPFADVLSDLRPKWKQLTKEEQANYAKKIAGQNAISGFNALLEASDSDFNTLKKSIDNCNGAADDMSKIMEDNLDGDLKKTNSNLEDMQIKLYEKLEPAFRNTVKAISGFIDILKYIIDNGTAVIATITGIASAFLTYLTVVTIITVMKNGLMALVIAQKAVAAAQWLINTALYASGIPAIIALIVGLVAGFIVLWKKSDKFRAFWINLWEKIKSGVSVAVEVIKNIWNGIVGFFTKAVEIIKSVWNGVVAFFKRAVEIVKKIFSIYISIITLPFRMAYEIIKGIIMGIWIVIKAIGTAIFNYWKFMAGIFMSILNALGIIDFFKNLWNWIVSAFTSAVNWIKSTSTSIVSIVKTVFGAIVGFFSGVWNGIKAVFSTVASFFASVFKGAYNIVRTVFGVIVGFFSGVWNGIKAVFSVVSNFFMTIFTNAVSKIKTAFNVIGGFFLGIWNRIKGIFNSVSTWFGDKFKSAYNNIKKFFEPIAGFFSGVWKKVKDIFKKVGTTISDAIGGSVKSAINTVLRAAVSIINGFIRAINVAVDTINKIPGVNISRISELEAPQLAKGGILKKGQVGLLEGKGGEAVIPLDRSKKWISALSREIIKQTQGLGFAVGSNNTNSNDIIFNQTINSPKSLSRWEIYKDTKRQINLMKMVINGNA